MRSTVSVLVLALCCLCSGQELLNNPGFENGVVGWRAEGFTFQSDSSTVKEGSSSALATDRTHSWQGPSQDVTLVRGRRYEFNAYLRFLDDFQGKGPQPVYVNLTSTFANGTKSVLTITSRLRGTPDDEWIRLGADFQYPNNPYVGVATVSIEGPAADVSFYLDDVSLVEVPEYTSWEEDANNQIEAHRKSNIHFTFTSDSGFAAKDLIVHIDQTRHLFNFGSVLRSNVVLETDDREYVNVASYLFNSATVREFQWNNDKGTQDSPDFSEAVSATNLLVGRGLRVRGDSLFSAVQGKEPLWVSPLTGQDLKKAVDDRIKYITGVTKGKIAEWEVNPGLVQGRFYEDRTTDPRYSQHIFQSVQAADPAAGLYLNEDNVLTDGGSTLEYLDQINQFKSANVGLRGAAVQSYFNNNVEPDVTLLKARLDRLAQAGVPLWITDLGVGSINQTAKADWYERALRLYFGHPAVEGISLDGFWDHDIDSSRAIVHGYTFTLDEAGKRFQHLVKEEWSTHVTKSLSGGATFSVRGFQGDYTVVVYNKGKPIIRTTFSLDKADKTINVAVTGSGAEIQLPPVVDPFQPVDIDFASTSLNLKTIGQASSNSLSSHLQCVTRRSALSQVGDDRTASVSCNAGEVLTGCSSYQIDNSYHRDGEQINFVNGKPTCTAFNGFYSTVGTQAIARCCSLNNLQCRYRTAGPSGTGEHDQIVVPCSGAEYPLGCGTWTFEEESSGTIFTSNFCVAQNDDPRVGVYAYSACCQRPNLHCIVLYSALSGPDPGDKGNITCPDNFGYVITGCNVYAPNGRGAGAYVDTVDGEDACIAVNGYQRFGNEFGVQAVVSCCRIADD